MADLSVTAADVIPAANAVQGQGTYGATVTAGQTLYEDTTDSNKLKLADADALATAKLAGIALNGGADGQPARYIKAGDYDPGATVTVGEVYVVSTTAGGIAPESDLASGDFPTLVGIGTTTSNINVQIHEGGVAKP